MPVQVKLREARALALLSMQELADKAGVSKAAIFKVEAGKVRRPRPKLVRLVCGVLGVEASAIDEFRPTLAPLERKPTAPA